MQEIKFPEILNNAEDAAVLLGMLVFDFNKTLATRG